MTTGGLPPQLVGRESQTWARTEPLICSSAAATEKRGRNECRSGFCAGLATYP